MPVKLLFKLLESDLNEIGNNFSYCAKLHLWRRSVDNNCFLLREFKIIFMFNERNCRNDYDN